MDRNTKVAFAVTGGLWLFGMWKQFRLNERIEMLEKIAAVIDQVVDPIYQRVIIDPEFDEMIDHFDEE